MRYGCAVSATLPRLAVLQALSFGSMGAVFPFLALELRGSGTTGVALVVAMTAIPVARLVLAPAWGAGADRLGRVRPVLLAATALTILGTVGLVALPAFLALGAALLLAAGRAGTGPLVDASSLNAVDGDTGRYGTLRRWGSLGFLAVVLVAGTVRDTLGLSPLWLGAALGLALLAVAAGLPAGVPPERRPLLPALLRLARDPGVLLLLAASAVHFAGISLYDGFFAVHLEAGGHGTTWVGVATVLGVGVEVVVLSLGAWLLRVVGPRTLLVLTMALNIPRWALTAALVSPWLVVPLQAIHGFTFGAFWLAAIALLSARAPRDLTGSTQGLLAASIGGVGAGIGNAIGSTVVEGFDSRMLFVVATVLAAIATGLAVGAIAAPRNDEARSSPEG